MIWNEPKIANYKILVSVMQSSPSRKRLSRLVGLSDACLSDLGFDASAYCCYVHTAQWVEEREITQWLAGVSLYHVVRNVNPTPPTKRHLWAHYCDNPKQSYDPYPGLHTFPTFGLSGPHQKADLPEQKLPPPQDINISATWLLHQRSPISNRPHRPTPPPPPLPRQLPSDDNRLERLDPKGCPPLGRKSHPSYRIVHWALCSPWVNAIQTKARGNTWTWVPGWTRPPRARWERGWRKSFLVTCGPRAVIHTDSLIRPSSPPPPPPSNYANYC